MKPSIKFLLLAAAMTCGLAKGQTTAYTTPVGYTTQTLAANTTNVVGINMLTPTLVSSKVTAVNGSVLTDSAVNFTNLLPVGKMCLIEITSGTAAGTVEWSLVWTGSDIQLPAAVTGLAVGDAYSIRVAPTLQEIFPVGLLASAAVASNADKVWVPTGPGTYVKYWYKIAVGTSPAGWHTTGTGSNDTGAVTGDVPLVYTEGLLVQKKSVAKDLVLTGEVKKTGSNVEISPGTNLVTVVPPAGLTLFTSGMVGDITSAAGASNADKVWVPTGPGTYSKYWYKIAVGTSPAGWHTTTTGSNDSGAVTVDVPLTPGMLIQQRSGTPNKVVTFDVPASYSTL